LRQPVLVDERDPRLGVRVAGDEPDEQRDEQRVRDEDSEQQRRAPQDADVLPQDEPGGASHARRAAAPDDSSSANGPQNASRPSASTATRSASSASSSLCWVENTTAPPRSRMAA